jgi:hypothetical protein
MAKKIKNSRQSVSEIEVSKLYTRAYGARLAREVAPQIERARPASGVRKKKPGATKTD